MGDTENLQWLQLPSVLLFEDSRTCWRGQTKGMVTRKLKGWLILHIHSNFKQVQAHIRTREVPSLMDKFPCFLV